MPYKNPPPCQVCGAPSAAKKLCDKHYRRWKKLGSTDATLRPDDWGKRHKHPLWHSWKWTARAKGPGRVKRWDDFWLFAADVGDRPHESSVLSRREPGAPFGPDNFYWSEPIVRSKGQAATAAGRAAYMRDWRKANPARAKHHDLKKMHGISGSDYLNMHTGQGGKCAICGGVDPLFNLAVDHCHDKKHIRGLLCSKCNRGLGFFNDNPERLRAAAAYLEDTARLI